MNPPPPSIDPFLVQQSLSKTATLKKTNDWFSRPIIAYAGQKYSRMMHSAILLTVIKLPFVIKGSILFIFWSGLFRQVLLYTLFEYG